MKRVDLGNGHTVGPILKKKRGIWKSVARYVVVRLLLLRTVRNIAFLDMASAYGRLLIGSFSDGHTGWRFRETGGGGAVFLPYAYDANGNLYVGLINEQRINMGPGDHWCVAGGFKHPEESAHDAQVRESKSETGLDTTDAKLLEGKPVNSNRNYFIADSTKDEGIHCFALEVPFGEMTEDPAEADTYSLSVEITGLKKQEHLRFFPHKTANLLTDDLIALGAIARLTAREL
mgnify:CR=1 FL=1